MMATASQSQTVNMSRPSAFGNQHQNIEVPDSSESSPDVHELQTLFKSEVEEVEHILEQIRMKIDERRQTLQASEVLKSKISVVENKVQAHLKHVVLSCSNKQHEEVPPHAQHQQKQPLQERQLQSVTAQQGSHSNSTSDKSSTPMYRNCRGKIVESPCGDSTVAGDYTPAAFASEVRKKGPVLFIPNMEHLTDKECEDVPKYMKGRTTCHQINTAIDELNKSIDAKYAIVNTQKSKMNDAVRTAIRAYKEQECKETKGLHFIVDADIVNFSRLRLDKAGRSILTILRHCRRLREVRGAGLVRYVIIG